MKQTVITFVAVYGLILGATSCSGSNINASPSPGASGANAQYIQVERLARPAVKEAFQMFENHDGTNRISPAAQPLSSQSLFTEIGSFTTTVAGRSQTGANANGKDVATTLQTILIPDEIVADLSQNAPAAGYLGVETGGAGGAISLFGGRALTDDVITTSLAAIFGPLLTTATGGLGLVPDDLKESPCLSAQNVIGTNGMYANTAALSAAKHFTATFPYVGAPY